ncbi:MAG: glycosyltransferase family 4 protein [bacterium]|nr:glycosyltransferase family 4 protein [bacterium]
MDNAKKPRILIFSLAYFPLVGGAEIAIKEITDRLGDSFDFDLITLRFDRSHADHEVIGNVSVYRVKGGKSLFPAKAFFLARRLHREKKYKLIWSIMAAYAGFGALFFKLFNPRVPFLLTLQEGDSEKHILKRVGIFYPLWKQIFKKADYIQTISKYLADFAHRYGAICPVEVVPNGVDLSKFLISNSQFLNKTKNPNVKIIITTSRLVYKNGVDILIRACAQLPITNYQLLIVGDGPDRSNLEKLTKDLGIVDQVKFVGHVDPDLIPKYLYQADLFVRPSRSEGLGNSFLEAMAAGLPVIGTEVGGIPDFLINNVNGLFCQVDDPDDLSKKITTILNDAELSHELSENGRKTVEENYSWENISVRMKQIMEKMPKKKLLLATGIYPPEIGGPATYAVLLEKELPKRGISVSVLPFRVVRNWPKGVRHLFYFFKVLRLCWQHDFVLAQDTISVGLPSMLATKLSGRKFIIRVPGDYVWEQSVQRFGVKEGIDIFQNKKYGWKIEFLRSIQKFVVGSADIVITPSNYFRDLVRGWVQNKDRVVTIYNGIKLENPKSEIRNPKQTSNSKFQTPKTIISAGRLVPWKGFSFLIELMKDLPEWKLIIAGDGPEHANLKSQVSNLGLQDRVGLLGQIPRDELMQKISEADIFMLNTSFESFSFQIVEAMSLGVPVIATNIGNLAEIVENGVEGLLVEPNNKAQFLNAINKLDNNKDFRKNIAEKAKIKAQKFSIENTINELIKLF